MKITFPTSLLSDARQVVQSAIVEAKEVHPPTIAQEIQARHSSANVALEDIELLVLKIAAECQAPLRFTKQQIEPMPNLSGDELQTLN